MKKETKPEQEKHDNIKNLPIDLLESAIEKLQKTPHNPATDRELVLAIGKIQEAKLMLEKRVARITAEKVAAKKTVKGE
jgi:hypothetical protein